MKVLWVFYLSFIFSFVFYFETNQANLSYRHIAQTNKTTVNRHVVFDLDWTLFSEFDSSLVKPSAARVFKVEGKNYYLTPYAEELIRFLDAAKIKVSFFSGGSESRNLALLDKAALKNGKSFSSLAYRVLSRSDLTTISNDESLSFTDRYKKDLTKITDDLENIILIEDNKNFALDAVQAKNIFWLGPTYQVLTKMEDVGLIDSKYLPPTKEAWDLSNHKLLILKEAIREAMSLEKSKGLSFKEAMLIMQRRLNFQDQKYSPFALNLKNKGLKFLPIIRSSIDTDLACVDILKPLLQNKIGN